MVLGWGGTFLFYLIGEKFASYLFFIYFFVVFKLIGKTYKSCCTVHLLENVNGFRFSPWFSLMVGPPGVALHLSAYRGRSCLISASLQLLTWRSTAVIHSCRPSVLSTVRDADGSCQEKRRVEPNYSLTFLLLENILINLKSFQRRHCCSRVFVSTFHKTLFNSLY